MPVPQGTDLGPSKAPNKQNKPSRILSGFLSSPSRNLRLIPTPRFTEAMGNDSFADQRAALLKLAGHIGHPLHIAMAAFVIAACVFAYLLRAKKPVSASFAAVLLILVGVTPYFSAKTLQSRGVYHVQVVLRRPDQSLADVAQLQSSNGGQIKMVAGGWELEVPQQARPSDGKIVFSGVVKDEFLKGSNSIVLDSDYYPIITIQLVADTSATVRGVVVDEDLVAIAGATVSVDGYPDKTLSDDKGDFSLPAHAGKGQPIQLHAHKGPLTGSLSVPAGKVVEVVLTRE